ncbi:deoxyribodipyrimidine photo-lyase [Shewanella psychromarinicola]|jgi:deoxyribodipyrimidine photo-lyase|uniref:deoxyribodipyrimidine photo-lyase n=1 Tax=Shewanella psychromarinicola TaxID=2487742 RepID=UPI003F4B86DA
MSNVNSLMWFRQDLRVGDNPALVAACQFAQQHQGKVRAVYIVTPSQWAQHDVAPIQIDFIQRHVNLLAQSLAALGISLDVLHLEWFSDTQTALNDYLQQHNIDAVFAGNEPEINERRRDSALIGQGLPLTLIDQDCVFAAGQVQNLSGDMYKVFTPFAKKWKSIASQKAIVPLAAPAPVAAALALPAAIEFNCPTHSSDQWAAGEGVAKRILDQFLVSQVEDYQAERDFPALEGTSRLSPFLAIGVMSSRQCVAAILARYPQALVDDTCLAKTWLNELIWREFYHHLLVAFPRLSMNHNFNELGKAIAWRNNPDEFTAWCDGQTGYPIVDAAMRQLNQTGWMHNRLRMVVASFLTKHLLIDWRWGERYFRQKLIDGDLAANNGGWQWSAGTGCDAQPYFRVFNPMTQSSKFDPDASFIKRYVSEVSGWSLAVIHQPKSMNVNDLFAQRQDDRYPEPIVEHKMARLRAIEVLSALKRG